MKYCDLVNTKQGSASVNRFSNGNSLPLVQLPFGMTAFAPQTNPDKRWYYHPASRSLEGVRLTHQPSPWIADYGAFVFMPQRSPIGAASGDRWTGYRPEEAVLTPYSMKLRFLRSECDFELAPTERGAVIRLNYGESDSNYFSVMPVEGCCEYRYDEASSTLFATTDMHMSGEAVNFKNYLVVRFPEGVVDGALVSDGPDEEDFTPGFEISGDYTAIHLHLAKNSFEIKLAASYIGFEQAQLNLEREIADKDFEAVRAEAEAVWESYLSRLTIEAEDEKQLRTFTSCLYRAFLYPHKCHEYVADGRAIHYCPHDGEIHDGVRYTDNGFWDTYRTVYPFFSLAAKDELKEMLTAFINEYTESGWLPRWLSIGECGCMPSTLVDAVICDAAVKGFIDRPTLEIAFEGMIKHSVTDAPNRNFGRTGAGDYCKLGWVPYDKYGESVNLTQDAAYGDWCIARVAEILGKGDIAAEYDRRAKNYRNIFDPETGFMRAKDSKGEFRPDFSPVSWGRDYTEGSAWQNSFAVPHDIEGLAELYGGREQLMRKIDELFAEKPHYEVGGYGGEIHEMTEMAAADFGQCAISNQPSFHIPYIYSALGEVDRTAYWVEKLCKEAFSYADDGFPGDEDNGTMALWYVFGVLGFYPFCPGKPEFVKGRKQVKRAFLCGREIDADSFDGNIIPYSALV